MVQDSKTARTIYFSINSGGFVGTSCFTLYTGPGEAGRIDTLDIIWAGSNTRQVQTGLAVNRLHRITERTQSEYQT